MRIEPGDVVGGRVVDHFEEVITAVDDGQPETKVLVTHHPEDADRVNGLVPNRLCLRTDYGEFVDRYGGEADD